MTAYWRSRDPSLSGDALSGALVSPEGARLANKYKAEVNPFVERHFAVRNRFFLTRCAELLKSGHYDGVVSFGSGLSLLTLYVAEQVADRDAAFLDTDLAPIIEMRQSRIDRVRPHFRPSTWRRCGMKIIDLEEAASQSKSFDELFPEVRCPICILEGVSYYLSERCLAWLFGEVSSRQPAAIVFDYWPSYATNSRTFQHFLRFLDNSVRERTKLLLSAHDVERLAGSKRVQEDMELRDLERMWVEQPQLVDLDAIVPSRFAVIA